MFRVLWDPGARGMDIKDDIHVCNQKNITSSVQKIYIEYTGSIMFISDHRANIDPHVKYGSITIITFRVDIQSIKITVFHSFSGKSIVSGLEDLFTEIQYVKTRT